MPGSCCLNHAEKIDTKSARVVVNDGKWQRLVWQHWLRMAAIPEGSWSRCDWKARCGRRWGSCKSYQESTKEFMFLFSASDMIENWEVATTMSCMGSQKVLLLVCHVQWKLHGILWNGILVRWCVGGGTATTAPQAPASEDVAEPEAPAQEQAAADEVCLGLYWTLRVSSVKASVFGSETLTGIKRVYFEAKNFRERDSWRTTLVLRSLHVAALRRTLHVRQADADATEEAVGFMGSEEFILLHLKIS